MAKVLLTGASGFVGSHVLPALLDAGHEVVALCRSEKVGARVQARIERGVDRLQVRVGDIGNVDSIAAAATGCDAIVHLVAIPRDWSGGRDLDRVNHLGTANVVAAAQRAGVRRFVHLGALGVEERAGLNYASSKARGERVVRESGLDYTIIKPSLIWGERDGFFNIVAALVRLPAPLVPVPGNGKSRFQPVWAGDVARAIVTVLADAKGSVGRAYELGGPRYWTYAEITREVARALNKRRLIIPMPVPLIGLVAGVSEAIRLPFPVATDQLRQLALDNIGALDAVERELGFVPVDMAGRLGYLQRKISRQ
ncbi:MAG: complex I NDUFA9 subunit family protein [Candidatus Limnocylindrus sp.]